MRFVIPEDELQFRASRAGGPGGQHVNKTATRIEVRWDVARSPTLSDSQRIRISEVLKTRMDRHGVLSVTSRSQRSQAQNRDAAVARLHELVNEALRTPKPRRKTHVPKAAIEARLESKRRRSETKRKRKPATPDD